MWATTPAATPRNPALPFVLWTALACVACCLAPLLAITGVGAALTSLASFVDPWLGIGTGATAFGIIGYLFMKRARRTLPTSEPAASTGAVCRLPTADRAQRTTDFRRLFDETLLERTRSGQEVVWRLRATELSERESHRLAALETRCCDGVHFDVRREGHEVVWRIAGPPSAVAVLDAFYELPVLVTTERANELWAALDRASCGGATTR